MASPSKHSKSRLITVVIPCFNESGNIAPAYAAVAKVFKEKLPTYAFEVLFCDNRSEDTTFAEIEALAQQHPNVRAIRYTRNYGFNKSLLTGYRFANGDAAIQLDCDLQDPPALFPQMIKLWEAGHDVVVGRRTERPEPKWLQALRQAFYRGLKRISSDNLVIDGGDFRLVDGHILAKLRALQDVTPYVRGLVSTLAKNQATFPYTRHARTIGQSKFPVMRLMGLAIEGVVNHSVLPLRLATWLGLAVGAFTLLLALGYLVARLFFALNWPEGFATTTLLQLGGISLNAVFLGILGEYLSRIYLHILQRPITVISDTVNLTDSR
jgi:polyisoprenyl-phosphate glycosyltransferase